MPVKADALNGLHAQRGLPLPVHSNALLSVPMPGPRRWREDDSRATKRRPWPGLTTGSMPMVRMCRSLTNVERSPNSAPRVVPRIRPAALSTECNKSCTLGCQGPVSYGDHSTGALKSKRVREGEADCECFGAASVVGKTVDVGCVFAATCGPEVGGIESTQPVASRPPGLPAGRSPVAGLLTIGDPGGEFIGDAAFSRLADVGDGVLPLVGRLEPPLLDEALPAFPS